MPNPNLPIAGNYNTYIGARYVPLVLGTWSATVAYEPLSIVTYNGNSYTSKTFVPAGIPVDNETYWANTGNYNAQVEQYRQEVEQYKQDVEDTVQQLNNVNQIWFLGKKLCVYGDSIAAAQNGYWNILKERFPQADITNRSVAGTIAAEGLQLIESATDLGTFDYIIVAFGTNETQMSVDIDSFYSTYSQLCETLQLKTNAEIIFILPPFLYRDFSNGNLCHNNHGYDTKTAGDFIYQIASSYNIKCIDFYYTGCNLTNYKKYLDNDSGGVYVHPLPSYHQILADVIEIGAPAHRSDRYTHPILYQSHIGLLPVGSNPYNLSFTINNDYSLFFPNLNIQPNTKYKIKGKTSAFCAIVMGGVTQTLQAGKFEIELITTSSQNLQINSGPTEPVTFTEFSICSENIIDNFKWLSFEAVSGVTALIATRFQFTPFGIALATGAYSITAKGLIATGPISSRITGSNQILGFNEAQSFWRINIDQGTTMQMTVLDNVSAATTIYTPSTFLPGPV